MNKSALIRIGLLLFALVNQALVVAGYNTLPFTEGDIEVLLSTGFTVVTSIIAAYKDNYVKKKPDKKRKSA